MISKTKLAMALFILSEASFFALLIFAYVFYHNQPEPGPNAANSLDLATTTFYSICLFSSSATLWLSDRRLKQRQFDRLLPWLFATILLGLIFLFGQGREYLRLFQRDVTISRNLFGTTFFTLTGFHGLHVFFGLCALTVVGVLAIQGRIRERHAEAVEAVGMYWHFVDVVWVIIFALVYVGAAV